ncbi:MAG TPA: MarR family transcriptional regulator [Solirubrobacteraceae bacterium]|nr:MarR family transcriptional regulator [Solirubrobacteraceae bacterium]
MQTTSTPELAGQLRLVIVRTARRLRQEAGGELSPSMTAALATVGRHGPLTPSELAARERIQRPTATRVLARLEEMDLIARTPDPNDRRSSLVAITEAGSTLLDALRTRKTAFLAERLEGLAADERAAVERAAGILERMLAE